MKVELRKLDFTAQEIYKAEQMENYSGHKSNQRDIHGENTSRTARRRRAPGIGARRIEAPPRPTPQKVIPCLHKPWSNVGPSNPNPGDLLKTSVLRGGTLTCFILCVQWSRARRALEHCMMSRGPWHAGIYLILFVWCDNRRERLGKVTRVLAPAGVRCG